jgi:hypothetical protein
MIWLFLSVALLLFVYHPGFRKVALWIVGSCLVIGLIGLMVGGP